MQLFSFSGGPWMDWNLVPWQPSPPLRLPPLQAWCPSLCDPGQSGDTNGDTNTVELLIVFSLRHLCFSPAVILAPCLCVLCVTVSAISSLAHTKMAPHLLLTHLSPLICEMCAPNPPRREILCKIEMWSYCEIFMTRFTQITSFTSNNFNSGDI